MNKFWHLTHKSKVSRSYMKFWLVEGLKKSRIMKNIDDEGSEKKQDVAS